LEKATAVAFFLGARSALNLTDRDGANKQKLEWKMSKTNANEVAEDSEVLAPVRKPSKGIYMLPNMITLAALFAGFYAIIMAINGRFELATVGIFSAMVLDSLDG
jgi:hypothetical protein